MNPKKVILNKPLSKTRNESKSLIRQGPIRSPCGRRILLADDDPGVRQSLAEVLQGEGFSVRLAQNGEEALDLASQGEFDLVLLDLNMPVKNGWDTFERLTSRSPLVPIIIITARPNQLFTALNAGVGALLEKPLEMPMLLKTINTLLAESAETRLARLTGQAAGFFYRPSSNAEPPRIEHPWGINE